MEYMIVFQLDGLALPDHWMKHFFLAHTYLELQLNEEAFQMYTMINEKGFSNSTYVMAQLAVAYHNLRGTSFWHLMSRTSTACKILVTLIHCIMSKSQCVQHLV